MDLYYDPVVNEHVSSPMGLIAPVWYLAPQRPDVARAAWELAVAITDLDGDGDPAGLDDPGFATLLALQTGEFDDGPVRDRLWQVFDEVHEPTWDHARGEFTFGFRLDEPHPRGQLNARAMAGWVCTPGAWSRIFSGPDDDRFDQPTVIGVDFPEVALNEARWDGEALHLAARSRTAPSDGLRTTVTTTALPPEGTWTLLRPDQTTVSIDPKGGSVEIELVADGGHYELRRT
ncbi:MAG: hypothetical protein P6D49_09625 [Acidimicrobiales bacterium]|nr:hypothetical protein [Acidimicrobiales bacterium]